MASRGTWSSWFGKVACAVGVLEKFRHDDDLGAVQVKCLEALDEVIANLDGRSIRFMAALQQVL